MFVLDERPTMTPHPDEVADALWVALGGLFHPRSAVPYHHTDVPDPFPGLDVGGRVVWGLTHRTLEAFASVLGLAFPLPR